MHEVNEAAQDPSMARVVERNIDALLKRRQQQARERSFGERLSDKVTKFAGSMTFVVCHLLVFGCWIAWNLGLFGLKPFDPSFVILAMEASVEAIFLSTFVLISQNRMASEEEQRAELDLQVSLLTEHELTRMFSLVRQMAVKMGVQEANSSEMAELEQDIHPERVMDSMDRITQQGSDPKNTDALPDQ